jgi:PilZ domain
MGKQDLTRTDPVGKQRSKRAVLLRHRFDTAEQIANHLHHVEGSTLFFFRAPNLDVPVGATVLMELCLDPSDQTRLLRGSVLARAEEQGLWLQFPSTTTARELEQKMFAPRKSRRVGTDRFVRLRCSRAREYLTALFDVSQGGARVGGGLPPGLAVGNEVDVVLAAPEHGEPPDLGRAKVVWVHEGEAGIVFDRTMPSTRVAITKFFHSIEAPWKQAIEARHLHDCCAKSGVLDPPVPRLRGKNEIDIDDLL